MMKERRKLLLSVLVYVTIIALVAFVLGDVPLFVEHCKRSLPWLMLRGVGLA
jgi:hypothetical protein